MVTIADDILEEGESTDVPEPNNIWDVTPQQPEQDKIQMNVPTPRSIHEHPSPGYYKALNKGQRAFIASLDLQDNSIQWALAAANPEPTL